MTDDIKKLIVDTIQSALQDTKREFDENKLQINNLKWSQSYNHIFDGLLKLDNQYGLTAFKFKRWSYEMVGILSSVGTLYTITSRTVFEKLKCRRFISKPHFTDAFSLKSQDKNLSEQISFLNITEIDRKSSELVLSSMHVDPKILKRIKRYAVLSASINHNNFELNSIDAEYLTKDYQVVKTESWSQFISRDNIYEIAEIEEKDNVTNDKLESENYLKDEIAMKTPLKTKITKSN